MELLNTGKRQSGRYLNPNRLLFVARMLVLYLILISGKKHILPPFLPFFSFLDIFREFSWLFPLIDWVYWISLAAILMGFKFQKFSFILSILIFFQILSSKGQYSTSFLYVGCMFFLIGLFQPGLEWTFRLQIALLYLGAGLNKLIDVDWLSGQYFENFIINVYPNSLNLTLASWVGERLFAQLISYMVIVFELILGLWALSGKKQALLVFCIICFHLSVLIFTYGKLSFIYLYLMSITSLLVIPFSLEPNQVFSFIKGNMPIIK